MDHLDPMRAQNFQQPITSEIMAETKKKLKESHMETDEEEAIEGADLVVFSETTQQIPEKKKEAFLSEAKEDIAQLDSESETFVEDATEKLIDSALKKEYGRKLIKNPGYKQMEAVIKRKILMDPEFRPIIEDFLGKLLESEEQ